MLNEIRQDHDAVYAAITHDNSGYWHLVRTHTRGRLAAVVGAALALWLCTPVYAADAAQVGKEAVISDAQIGADNTARNERDRGDATLTPIDQSNDAHDIALTANIRKAVLADKSLGINAQNVKVITMNGRVTLRGPVDSSAERTRILEVAQRIAGVANVTNEIELAAR